MPQISEYVCIHSTLNDPVNNCHQDYKLLQEENYISQEDMLSERTQQYISETKETCLNAVNWPVNIFQKPSACSSNTGKSTNIYSCFPASKMFHNIRENKINEQKFTFNTRISSQ